MLRVLHGSVQVVEPERNHLYGLLEDRNREELSPPAGPTLGLGQPSILESRSTFIRDHDRAEHEAQGFKVVGVSKRQDKT